MKTWRQDLHVIPLGGWALLCIITAFAIFQHRHGPGGQPFRVLELLVGVAVLIVAPTVFAIYLWRARSVWVKLDPAKGLLLPGGGLIGWESIRRVRRKRPYFHRRAPSLPRSPNERPAQEGIDGWVEAGLNLSGGISLAIFVITTTMTVLVTVTTLFLIPVFEVLTPFGERFTIETTSGRPLVLRDLRDADTFADELSRRVPVA